LHLWFFTPRHPSRDCHGDFVTMILNRGIVLDDLVLVRCVKPCTAILKVGEKVRLNSSNDSIPVVTISRDNTTVE
jgi:hypothetical protein